MIEPVDPAHRRKFDGCPMRPRHLVLPDDFGFEQADHGFGQGIDAPMFVIRTALATDRGSDPDIMLNAQRPSEPLVHGLQGNRVADVLYSNFFQALEFPSCLGRLILSF